MSYRPLSQQEASTMKRPPLIEDGTYQFEVMEISNTNQDGNPLRDSKGGEMTRVRLKIWDNTGAERSLFTNLFWSDQNKMSYRTRYFAESIDMLPYYDRGDLYNDIKVCLNRTGYCDVYTQKERNKNDGSGEQWPAKNDIRDFVMQPKGSLTRPIKPNEPEFINDEIPW